MGEYSLTLGDIIDQTLKNCGDYRGAGNEGFRFSRAQIIRAFNALYLDLAKEYRFLRKTDIVQLIADQEVYSLPTDAIIPVRYSFEGDSSTLLLPMELKEMDVLGHLRSFSGTPTFMWVGNLPINQFGMNPVPSVTGNTPPDEEGNVKVTYVRAPEFITLESEYPDIGIPGFLHMFIPYGVAVKVLSPENDKVYKDKTTAYSLLWDMGVDLISENYSTLAFEEGAVPG